ncbi:MAG: FAD-dependent oxidoreductase [Methylococcales bacterium]
MMHLVILGAGPAGLAAALELTERNLRVTVLEKQNNVGGNAASFNVAGIRVDYGSHRLHPASDPAVLDRIKNLLGLDLLERPRHGRIRLLGRWIHFPLRPVDLLVRLHPRFAAGVAIDMVKKLIPSSAVNGTETFETLLEKGLGRTICREFYFPYAKKIWGLNPGEISPTQAEKRVSANSIGKMILRLFPSKSATGAANTKGIFYYPRQGFGQISESLYGASVKNGAEVILNATISRIRRDGDRFLIAVEKGGQKKDIAADRIFSTIPVTILCRLLDPPAPRDVLQAVDALEFRAMILIYLVLEQDQFTEFDAHYFPETEFTFTRLSEPKNYSASKKPEGRTVLCAELPCSMSDEVWARSDRELGELVKESLDRAGLPIPCAISHVEARRIPHAYPLYRVGYERPFETIDRWLDGLDGLLTFGRQGLYAHDNTHHAMYMAQSAAKCLRDDGTFDRDLWHRQREIFKTHRVED